MTRLADGRFDVRFKLWDVVKGSELGGQSNAVEASDLRLAAHRIADFIYEKLTGEKGVFSTRIAYVTRGRQPLHAARRRRRRRGRPGGAEQRRADHLAGLVARTAASWPTCRSRAQKAVVYVQDVATGKRRAIADFRGSNSAPAWSPDGQTPGRDAVARRRLAAVPDRPQRRRRRAG